MLSLTSFYQDGFMIILIFLCLVTNIYFTLPPALIINNCCLLDVGERIAIFFPYRVIFDYVIRCSFYDAFLVDWIVFSSTYEISYAYQLNRISTRYRTEVIALVRLWFKYTQKCASGNKYGRITRLVTAIGDDKNSSFEDSLQGYVIWWVRRNISLWYFCNI